MNRIYRVVWNQAHGCFVAAAENVRSKGKTSSAVSAPPADAQASLAYTARNIKLALKPLVGAIVIVMGLGFGGQQAMAACDTSGTNVKCGNGAGTNGVTGGQRVAIGGGSGSGEGAQAIGDQSIAIGGNTKATGNSSIVIGGDDTDKVSAGKVNDDGVVNGAGATQTVGQIYSTATGQNLQNPRYRNTEAGEGSIAIGVKSTAKGALASAFGTGAAASKNLSVALGVGAAADKVNAVAIGAGAKTDVAGTPQTGASVGGEAYTWAGGTNVKAGDVVSFGSAGTGGTGGQSYERQLKNVAAGEVSKTSTDAINGSQLHAIAKVAGEANNKTNYFHVNTGVAGQPAGNATTNEGAVDAKGGATGARALAAGVNAKASNQAATAIGSGDYYLEVISAGAAENAGYAAATTADVQTEADGRKYKRVKNSAGARVIYYQYDRSNYRVVNTSATGVASTALGSGARATGAGATALGVGAEASQRFSTAIGHSANATGKESTAIGFNTKAETLSTSIGANSKSFGSGSTVIGTGAAGSAHTHTISTGINATAISTGARSKSARSTAIGDHAYTERTFKSKDSTKGEIIGNVSLGVGSVSNRGPAVVQTKIFNRLNELKALAATRALTDVEKKERKELNQTIIKGRVHDDVSKSNKPVQQRVADKDALAYDPTTGNNKTQSAAIAATNSTIGAVSVGGSPEIISPDNTGPRWLRGKNVKLLRQITNVAGGSQPTDAVNVAQLQAVTALANRENYFHTNDGTSTQAAGDATTNKGTVDAKGGATGKNALAAGVKARAKNDGAVAVGHTAEARGVHSVAVGANSLAKGTSVAIGKGATTDRGQGIAIGSGNPDVPSASGARTKGPRSIAIGISSEAGTDKNTLQAVALGYSAKASGDQSTALGSDAVASGASSIALGGNDLRTASRTHTDGTVVAGTDVNTGSVNKAFKAISGKDLVQTSDGTPGGAVIYTETTASGASSTAVGTSTVASGHLSTAFGTQSKSEGVASLALGTSAVASKDGSVALGTGSTTATDATKVTGANTVIGGNTYNLEFKGEEAVVAGNQVSVGKAGYERQIKHVAPGAITATSTDAINGSQLHAVATELDRKNYFHTNPANTAATASNTTNLDSVDGIGGAKGGHSLAAGVNATTTGSGDIAIGYQAKAASSGDIRANPGYTNNNVESGALAIGVQSKAETQATVVGNQSEAKLGATAIGRNTRALGDQSTAIGNDTDAIGHASIAIGGDDLDAVANTVTRGNPARAGDTSGAAAYNNTQEAKDYKDITGNYLVENPSDRYKRTKTGLGAVAVGVQSQAAGLATAFGTRTRATGVASTALGVGSTADKKGAVALGAGSTTATNATKVTGAGTVIGGTTYNLTFKGEENVVAGDQVSIGAAGYERQIKHVAPGEISKTSTDAINGSQLYAVAEELDRDTYFHTNDGTAKAYVSTETNKGKLNATAGAFGANSLAAGIKAHAVGSDTTAFGSNSKAYSNNATAIGKGATAGVIGGGAGLRATAIGTETEATGNDAVALAYNAKAEGVNSVAIGNAAHAHIGGYNTALGGVSIAKAKYATAVGYDADAKGNNSTAIGSYAQALKGGGIAIGGGNASPLLAAQAKESNAIAIGVKAVSGTIQGMALGVNSNVTGAARDGVALGSNSLADIASGTPGYVPAGVAGAEKTAIENTTKGTLGVVSVGNASNTRQIINVAAGTANSDAVNVAQLKAVANTGFNITADDKTGLALGATKDKVGLGETVEYKSTDKTVVTKVTDNAIDFSVATTSLTRAADGSITEPVSPNDKKMVNAGDVATAINSAGWNIKNSTGTAPGNVALITAGDNVDFVNGTYTKATVSKAGNTTTVKYDVAASKAKIQFSDGTNTSDVALGGKYTIQGVANEIVATDNNRGQMTVGLHQDVKDAIAKETTVAAGDSNVSVTQTALNTSGGKRFDVKLADTVTIGSTNPVTVNGTDGTVKGLSNTAALGLTTTPTGGQAATQEQVVKTIVSNPITFTGNTNADTDGVSGDGTQRKLGEALAIVGADSNTDFTKSDQGKNIFTKVENEKVIIALAEKVEVTSVKTGSTLIKDSGMTITGGPSVTKTGIDAGGNKITSVATGTANDDGVNVKQLKDEIANVNLTTLTQVTANSPFSYQATTGPSAGKALVRYYDSGTATYKFYKAEDMTNNTPNAGAVAVDPVTSGIVISTLDKDGKPLPSMKVANVTAGTSNLDAVNVKQLKDSVKIFGGGAQLNADGSIKAPKYTITKTDGSTYAAADNVGSALSNLNAEVVKPITFTGDTGSSAQKLGSTFNIAAGNAADTETTNLKTTVTAGKVEISMAKAPTFAGKVTAKGFDATNNTITSVADGVGDTDAVNVRQLTKATATTPLSNDSSGTVNTPAGNDANKLVTAGDIAAAINKSGFNIQANTGAKELVKAGDTVNFVQGDNVAITRSGKDIIIKAEDTRVAAGSADLVVTANETTGAGTDTFTVDLAAATKTNIQKGVDAKEAVDTKGLTFTGDSGATNVEKLGSSVAIKGDSNITTEASGDQVQVKLNNDITVNQVTANTYKAGAVTIDGNTGTIKGLSNTTFDPNTNYTGGQAATQEQLQQVVGYTAGSGGFGLKAQDGNEVAKALGNTVEVVGTGTDTTAAYSGSNLKTVVSSGKVEIQMTDRPQFGNVKVNDGGTGKITGVAAGTATADAVNVSQLTDVANIIGGNQTAVNNTTGRVAFGDAANQGVGDTGKTTIHDAIKHVNTGFAVAANSNATPAPDRQIKPTDTLTIKGTGTGAFAGYDATNLQTQVSADKTVTIGLKKDLKVTSVAAGDTTINDSGITISNGNAGGAAVSLTKGGLNNGGNKITSVADGTVAADSKDAVTGGQLHTVKETPLKFVGNNGVAVAKKLGDTLTVKGTHTSSAASAANVRVDNEGGELIVKIADSPVFAGTVKAKDVVASNGTNTITLDSNSGTVKGLRNTTWTTAQVAVDGQAATENQLKVVSDIAANANKGFNLSTTASAGGEVVTPIAKDQVKPTETVTFDAGKNIKLTQGDNRISVATRDEVSFTKTTVGNVVTDSTTGKITGLTNGDVTATSKDAINGSQLHNTNQTVSNIIGGTTNTGLNTDGTVKQPTFVTNGNTYNNVGDALEGLGAGTFGITAQDTNTLSKTLNNNIAIVGGASASAAASTVNTRTVVKDGKIEVQVVDAPTFQEVTLGDAINSTTLKSTARGLDVGGDQITNVASAGDITDAANAGNVANAGDVHKAITTLDGTLTAKGLDFGGNEGAKVHRDLGTQLNVLGSAGTAGTYSGANVKTVTDPSSGAINIQIANAPVFTGKVSARGLDAGGEKVTNVQKGSDDLDAVNFSQLQDAIADVRTQTQTTVETNSPFSYTGTVGTDTRHLVRKLDGSGTPVFYTPEQLNADGTPKPGQTPVAATNIRISALNPGTGQLSQPTQVVNVAKGTNPTDAVNVSQLRQSVTALGGGAQLNADGSIKAPEYTITRTDGSTGTTDNVGDALGSLNAEVVKPITFTGDTGSSTQKLGSAFNIAAGNAADTETTNLKTTVTAGKVEISMAKAPTFAGKVTAKGFDATGNKLENVAAGTVSATSKDAINGSQLHAVTVANKKIFGGNATVETDGTVTMSDVGNTGKDNIHDAIASIGGVAAKGFNVTAQGANSSNVAPGETLDLNNADGNITVVKKADEDKVTFGLAKDITVDSVTAGGSKLDNNGLVIAGGPSVTRTGINVAGNKVTGVAAGDVTAVSTDAINGSQLHQITGDMTANYINRHGAGIKYFRANSTGSDASARGADAVAVGKDAVAEADKGVALGAGSVAVARDANQVKGYIPEAIEVPNPNDPANPVKFGPSQAQVAAVVATHAKTNVGAVSVGDEVNGVYRQITGVAAGNKDTDAVNVAQLKAVQFGVNNVIDRAVKYDLNRDGTVNYNNVTMGAGHLQPSTDGGKTGGVKLSNLAQGDISANSTDSINGAQLYTAGSTVANIIGGDQSKVNSDGSIVFGDSANKGIGGTGKDNIHDAIAAVDARHSTVSAGDNMVVTPVTANGKTDYRVATAKDVNFDSVTVGSASISKDAGINAGDKQIKGVASGLVDATGKAVSIADASGDTLTNAANIGDLQQVQSSVTNVNADVTRLKSKTTNVAEILGDSTQLDPRTGAATAAGKEALTTYSVEDRKKKTDNTVISAIQNMNEGGIKYFHTNNTKNNFATTGTDSGDDSSAGGSYSTAVGYKARTEGARSVALGNETFAQGESAVAIGDGSQARGKESIAIGKGNVVSGAHSGAIGDPNTVSGTGSYVLGNNNTVAADNVFVAGNNVNVAAGNDGAVVLGDKSTVEAVHKGNYTLGGLADKQVAGKTGDGTQVVSVGSKGNERQIQNVAPGVVSATSTDAINGSQLYNTHQAIAGVKQGGVQYATKPDGTPDYSQVNLAGAQYNPQTGEGGTRISNVAPGVQPSDAVNVQQLRGLDDKVNNVSADANAGTASALAAGSIPQAVLPGKGMVGVGVGHYRGTNALAVGASAVTDNGRWIFKGTVNVNSRGHTGVGVGAGFQW